ncbi:Biotin/lipoyl attachment [Dillenia turbinata]|uniref:Biotin carboxyl carrier protein of acetyl-CoA carboxylase n=1 Tax=Dillenia turbinata TaxID=194707 RepID=A0AAN8V4A6_9MAGN
MASSSLSIPCPKRSSLSASSTKNQQLSRVSFASLKFQSPDRKQFTSGKLQAKLNDIVSDKSSNSVPLAEDKSKAKAVPEEKEACETADPSEISAFMAQVADLVKLVDSRDITELQLKQLDCELIIRKKEALVPPPSAAPVVTYQAPFPQSVLPAQPPPAAAPAAPAPAPAPAASAPSAPALPAPTKTSSSSLPPLKCPMAGTFYRSPGPGEPPFVKVGDKVQKGQVLCIIEAMKLMNEIEADQSGTIVEILVEDRKPVSVDMPLFVIAP